MNAAENLTPDPVEPDAEPEEGELEPDAEPDDDDADSDEDGEPEARQHQPSSLTVVEGQFKAMSAASKTHESRLRTILGDAFDHYMPCPLCLGDAFLIPTPPGRIGPEQWEAIQLAAGMLPDENLMVADYAERCDKCNGYGVVLSGSLDPTHAKIVCRTCEGKGWKAKLVEAPPMASYTFPTATTATPTLNLDFTGPKDNWGRPAGHPHFGIEPALVVA